VRPRDLGIGRLFERIRDGAIVAEAKTQRIVLWNTAAANIFGYSTSEALRLRVEALVPEHFKGQHRAGIARYAETGHPGPIFQERSLPLSTTEALHQTANPFFGGALCARVSGKLLGTSAHHLAEAPASALLLLLASHEAFSSPYFVRWQHIC
jgi:PAS domain-containing protein